MTDYRDPRPDVATAHDAVQKRMAWERKAIRDVNRDEDAANKEGAMIEVLWSGEVPDRGRMRYVLYRGRHWWQFQQASGEWCTTTGDPSLLSD